MVAEEASRAAVSVEAGAAHSSRHKTTSHGVVSRQRTAALLHLERQPLQLTVTFHLEHYRRARFKIRQHGAK